MTIAMRQTGDTPDLGATAESVAVERKDAGKPVFEVGAAKAAVQDQLGFRPEMLTYAGDGKFDLTQPHSGGVLSACVEVVVTDGSYTATELY